MKKFLTIFVLCILVMTTLGCQPQSSAVSGPSVSHDLMGQGISFVAPSDPWVEKVQTIGEGEAELGMPADTVVAITYQKPESEGLIAIAGLGQQKNEAGEFIELENDLETLNQIAHWVDKRDGTRTKEEYIKVLGVNAFHMVFEIGKDKRAEKGEQVHFTKDGKHYTLSILVPAQDYDSEIGHFRNLVTSFTTK